MEEGRTLTDRLFLSTMGEPGGQQFLLQVRGWLIIADYLTGAAQSIGGCVVTCSSCHTGSIHNRLACLYSCASSGATFTTLHSLFV
jgi:hypothetical protein